MKERLIEIGAVRKTHGYSGELKLHVFDGHEEDVEEAEFLFIGKTEQAALPYEILALRGIDWIVKLDGIPNREAAAALRGVPVYLKASEVSEVKVTPVVDDQLGEYGHLAGYLLRDEELGEIGRIADVIAYPQQIMASLPYRGRMVLVPLNENFIKSISPTDKRIEMLLPAGILDL